MEHNDAAALSVGRIKLEDQEANGASSLDASAADRMDADVKKEESSRSPSIALNAHSPSAADDSGMPTSERPAKPSRKASSKPPARRAPLFDDLPDATSRACEAFQVIPDCLYGSKNMGATDNDAFDCECREEWRDGENQACGEDSDCINRATKMECTLDANNCGGNCRNQRFQRKEYAHVSVIDTGKKGFGLRADVDLHANDFIFEYIGEVINEPTFRRRMVQYDQQGIKHFYFMSLSRSEFVDATRKGNLGRFCNHSCNPNCYVDKWVVGDKLRMGIFALRKVVKGEELVFNYNVDRYGADPQPCYCGEPNCVGFIGGKTQTERATKLPESTVAALGIDGGDGWDTTVAKKPRKKRPDEDDEDYISSLQPRSLTEQDAPKVMAELMQCKEKWIAVKLLERIQRCEDERVLNSVLRLHAYQILKTTLNTFLDDSNIVLQILSILERFPRLTRNKITDSKIDTAVEACTRSEHAEVAETSKRLMDDWTKLEVAYRIPRRDPKSAPVTYDDRRGGHAREEPQIEKTPLSKPIDAPKGPRSNVPQRREIPPQFNGRPLPPARRGPPLPEGWHQAKAKNGRSYFYDKNGNRTWTRPSQPAVDNTASRARQEQQDIANIIKRVTKEAVGTPDRSSTTPQRPASPPAQETKQEKWRALPVDKQMKIYENTVFPHVKRVLDKFRHKLPKDDLKRLGKEVNKKMVASDYKNDRVQDPTAALTEKQAQKVKNFVNDFLKRAVEKYGAQSAKCGGENGVALVAPLSLPSGETPANVDTPTDSLTPSNDVALMEDGAQGRSLDADAAGSPDSVERKRKREGETLGIMEEAVTEQPESKRRRDEAGEASSSPQSPPPPPPPPPPPADNAEQEELREQEEALERENEEAQRLEDEAVKTEMLEKKTDEMQKEIDAAKTGSTEVLSH